MYIEVRANHVRNHVRLRVMDPRKFVKGSLRTQHLSKTLAFKRIGGILKSNGKWATQAFLWQIKPKLDDPPGIRIYSLKTAERLAHEKMISIKSIQQKGYECFRCGKNHYPQAKTNRSRKMRATAMKIYQMHKVYKNTIQSTITV